MARQPKFRKRLRGALGPALAAVAVLAIIGYAFAGPTGLFAWGDYRQAVTSKKVELAELRKRELELRNQVKLLDHRRADPDMVDELVRRELGVSHPDEVIIMMDPEVPSTR
jgi:cell division protein FtsB